MLDAGQHVHEYSTPTRKTCALATCSARAATSTDGVLRPPCRLSGGATASAVHRLQVERQERARCSCPAVTVGLAMWWAAAAAARAGRPPEQRGCARGDGRAHQVTEGSTRVPRGGRFVFESYVSKPSREGLRAAGAPYARRRRKFWGLKGPRRVSGANPTGRVYARNPPGRVCLPPGRRCWFADCHPTIDLETVGAKGSWRLLA